MFWCVILVTWGYLNEIQATPKSPKIVIVGAGVSAVSAATRLIQNGYNDIILLEAGKRIGGRIYTRKHDGYMIDVGAQWVHGQKGNVAYELAWPQGVIDHSLPSGDEQFFSSSDPPIPNETLEGIMGLYSQLSLTEMPEEYTNKSMGDYVITEFNKYFEAHPEITTGQQSSITNMLNLMTMGFVAADSWYDLAGRFDISLCEGDQHMDWKDKGYSTILDILVKKIPNPFEEIPLRFHTILKSEVSQINYNNTAGRVRVVTVNGNEYIADHVIVTVSIGVLKADHKTMFNPQLSDTKIQTMEGLQLGNVVKLFLSYDKPWWLDNNGEFNSSFGFYWTEEDRAALENDPEKSWMLGVVGVTAIAHKPRLLLCWVTGPRSRQMETLPEYQIWDHVKELFHRFFGKTYNLTEPTGMVWSKWASNKHFRGTWSFRNPQYVRSNMNITDLSDPIVENGKPVILFAGEATSPTHFSTVHGAIESGWREADRLKKFYDDQKTATATN